MEGSGVREKATNNITLKPHQNDEKIVLLLYFTLRPHFGKL